MLKYLDADKTLISRREKNGHIVVIEIGDPRFEDWAAESPALFVPPSQEEIANIEAGKVRNKRDALLAACDWTQLPDAPVDQTAWAAYRQALRDIPDQPGFPANVVWPVAPS